jgi:hypothetical protein
MSYGLTVNGNNVIKEEHGSFNSYWLGYNYNIQVSNEGKANIYVDKCFLAIYCSHETAKDIPQLGQKHYGVMETKNLNKLEITGGEGNKIVMKELEYKGMEAIEAANQAMQLHLFQFRHEDDEKRKKDWIDDSKWYTGFRLEGEEEGKSGNKPWMTRDGNPFWTRHCDWGQGGNGRYCHVTAVRRDANGIDMMAMSMPYQAKSLFREWLKNHLEPSFPKITIAAKKRDLKGKAEDNWKTELAANSKNLSNESKGVAMVMEGAFSTIHLDELLDESWYDALAMDHDQMRWHKLLRIVSSSSEHPLTLHELRSRDTNSVYKPNDPNYAQEFFMLSLKGLIKSR